MCFHLPTITIISEPLFFFGVEEGDLALFCVADVASSCVTSVEEEQGMGDKCTFIGKLVEKKKAGKGILIYEDGAKFDGTFVNDESEGKGAYFLQNGSKFEGEFKNGKMNGPGTFTLPDGTRFEGYSIIPQCI